MKMKRELPLKEQYQIVGNVIQYLSSQLYPDSKGLCQLLTKEIVKSCSYSGGPVSVSNISKYIPLFTLENARGFESYGNPGSFWWPLNCWGNQKRLEFLSWIRRTLRLAIQEEDKKEMSKRKVIKNIKTFFNVWKSVLLVGILSVLIGGAVVLVCMVPFLVWNWTSEWSNWAQVVSVIISGVISISGLIAVGVTLDKSSKG